jgi:REP element-mobilizing transposase RayT
MGLAKSPIHPASFIAGGSFFFTVNLAQRRLRLLTDYIDTLRTAFRETRQDHPFTIEASREMMGIASLHPSYGLDNVPTGH